MSPLSESTVREDGHQDSPRSSIIARKPVTTPSDEEVPLHTSAPRASSSDSDRTTEEASPSPGQDIKATHYWWWWDIAGASLSVISMVAMAILLSFIHNTPLESWPLEIQPNSVISVLTTITKTAMLVPIASCISQLKWRHITLRPRPLVDLQVFDGASRGPWGSAVMIWQLPLQSKLACALAVVTLLALGIDPSAQQILDFPLKDRTLDGELAELGQANVYFAKGFIQREGGHWLNYEPNSELAEFQSTILHGLAGSPAEPAYRCPPPATKCEWRDFSTMGVCGSLRDVTDKESRKCRNSHDSGMNPQIQNCTYSIPLGDSPGDETEHELELRYIDYVAWSHPMSAHLLRTEFIPGGDTSGWVGQLVVVRHESLDWPEIGRPPEPDTVAVADFRWCKKTYKLESVNRGRYSSNEAEVDVEFLSWVDRSDHGGSDWEGFYLRDILATPSGKDRYSITRTVENYLPKYLSYILSVEHLDARNINRPRTGIEPTTAMHTEFILYKADLLKLTQDLASTLTNVMRKDAGGDNAKATMSSEGRAFLNEPFIIVRWPWLVLPAVEVLLAVVLLAWTIIETAKTPLLKASLLAFLMYPLQGWTDDETHVQGLQTSEKLEEMSKSMRGRMETDEGRYRIVRQD